MSSSVNGWVTFFSMRPCYLLCSLLEISGSYVLPPKPFLTELQKEGGILMPDRASIYVAGIEDAEYKSDKIECKLFWNKYSLFTSLGQRLWLQLWMYQRDGLQRASG